MPALYQGRAFRLHNRLICSASATVLAMPLASPGDPITIDRHWARLIPSFRHWSRAVISPEAVPLAFVEELCVS